MDVLQPGPGLVHGMGRAPLSTDMAPCPPEPRRSRMTNDERGIGGFPG